MADDFTLVVKMASADVLRELQRMREASERTASSVEKLGRSGEQTSRRMGGLQRSSAGLSNALRGLAGLVGGISFAALIRDTLQAGVAMERLQNRFKLVSGSVAGAERDFAAVREMTRRLGLDLKTTAEQYTAFAVATKGTRLEGAETLRIFEAASKAIRVLGLSTADAQGVFRALTQMMSKGKVTAEELRQQLGDRLPGAVPMLARALGVSTAALDKMMEKGEVLAEVALPKLADEMERTFGKGATDAANSMQAQAERIGNAWFELQAKFTQTIGPAITTTLEKIVFALQFWVDKWDLVRAKTNEAIGAIAGAFRVGFTAIFSQIKLTAEGLRGFVELTFWAFEKIDAFFGKPGASNTAALKNSLLGPLDAVLDKLDALGEAVIGTAADIQEGMGVKATMAMDDYRRSTEATTTATATLGAVTTEVALKSEAELKKLAAAIRAAQLTAPIGSLDTDAGTGAISGAKLQGRNWWDSMVASLKPLSGGLPKIKIETREIADHTEHWSQGLAGVAAQVGQIFSSMSSGADQAIGKFAILISQTLQLVGQLQAAGNNTAALAAGVAGGVGAAFSAFGGATGDRGKGKFGGQLSGDHSDTGAAVGAVIGGIAGSFIPVIGTAAGALIGQTIGMIVGSFIKRGADEGLVQIRKQGEEILVDITKNEGGLGEVLGQLGQGIADWFGNLEEQLGTKIVDFPFFSLKLRDDIITVFIGNISAQFETVEEAMEFAIIEALKHTKFSGGMSANVAAVLENNVFDSLEELNHAISVALAVDRLGIDEFQLAIRDSFDELMNLAEEIERLGGSAENVYKALGELTNSRRNAILGIVESEEEKLRREAAAYNEERLRLLDQYNTERAAVQEQLAQLQLMQTLMIGTVSQETINDLIARLQVLDAAIGAVAPEITQTDIDTVLNGKKKGKGGGGNKAAREGFEDGLLGTIASGLGVVDAMMHEYTESVAEIQEQTKKLKGDANLAARAIEVLGNKLRENLAKLAADIGASFGTSTFATRLGVAQMRADLDAMAQAMLAAGASMDQVLQALGEANLQIFLGIAEGLAEAIGDEETLKDLQKLRHELELYNYRLQIQLLKEAKIITDAQARDLDLLVTQWDMFMKGLNPNALSPGGDSGAGSGTGSGTGGALDGWTEVGGGWWRRPDGSLVFISSPGGGTDYGQGGGSTPANDNTFDIGRALEPIRSFQAGLFTSELSPLKLMDQLGMAQGQFSDLIATGDATKSGEIAGLAQTILQLAQQIFPTGSAAYRNLFESINQDLLGFQQTAIDKAAEAQLITSQQALEEHKKTNELMQQVVEGIDRLNKRGEFAKVA